MGPTGATPTGRHRGAGRVPRGGVGGHHRGVPPVSTGPERPLDIRALLHPAEHSRLLIALSSSAVVFGVAAMFVYKSSGWTALPEYAVIFAAACGLFWLSLQVFRSRLLGGAVRVSETTFPDLQVVFDEVRGRLDYYKDIDVYVMDKVDGGSSMTSYLGTRLSHVCSTPTLNSATSGFNAAASRACVIAPRVSIGSMILSIHSRAAP